MSAAILAESSQSLADVMFWAFGVGAGASAVGLVASRNIVRMAVFLLFTLASVAGLYFTLNAEFLAAVQLVVYAGGTLILIVFGVMLTSKSPFSRFAPRPGEIVVALVVAVLLLSALAVGIHSSFEHGMFAAAPLDIDSGYPLRELGQTLLGDYLVPFELSSVLLLVVMIGAAYLAKARRRPREGE